MIFLDTSAIYALADQADPNHAIAKQMFQAALDAGEEILTQNYVLVESMALIQQRLGKAAALRLAEDSDAFEIEWVDSDVHRKAVLLLARTERRRVSFVDQVSF
ncbi:MAG TPA: PIN domain-containing protein, partial [Acidobacteriota bacterium]|nr:PIN domain-containing protein [Acidobacteriota bacterium]